MKKHKETSRHDENEVDNKKKVKSDESFNRNSEKLSQFKYDVKLDSENHNEEVKSDGPLNQNSEQLNQFKFVVFIGRFEPMLYETHFGFCINECIKQKNLIPIIFNGSPNSPEDLASNETGKPEIFKPWENPLTYEQRLTINKKVIEKISENASFDFIPDFGDGEKWAKCVVAKTEKLLATYNSQGDCNYSLNDVLFFGIGKSADKDESKEGGIAPLSSFLEGMRIAGFGGIYSPIPSDEMEKISASKYRKISVYEDEFSQDVVGSEEIRVLAEEARDQHQLSEAFKKINFPITMMDLALKRIDEEIKGELADDFFSEVILRLADGEYSPSKLYDHMKNYFTEEKMKKYVSERKRDEGVPVENDTQEKWTKKVKNDRLNDIQVNTIR